MEEHIPEGKPLTLLQRIRHRLVPGKIPSDDRGRMRLVLNNLVLHLHPARVDERTLKWTCTWGLGGLSAVLMVLLGITGAILLNNYAPSAPQAYLDILDLRSNVWFGELVRNVHHWSANLLVVIAVLHLLRVFLTGAYRPPREANWLIGVGMLVLILISNFTGYLLPWDQLAYWAITVGTSILSYVPWIGEGLTKLILGGPEVGANTLLNFYSLHISFIPLFIFGLMSFHFWRVRKDGGLTIPRCLDDPEEAEAAKVTTIPHLVRKELIYALGWVAVLLVFAMLVPAPLEGIADPNISPNPAKAPWYFLGLQELLLHFHPLVAGVFLPLLAALGIFLLPFLDTNPGSVGVYFRSNRGKALGLLALGLAILLTPTWVLLDEYLLNWTSWLPTWPALISNGLIPLAVAALPIILIDDWVKKQFTATIEERILFIFIFLFAGFLILTLIGIFFRGPGMALYWPWDMPAVVH